MLYHDWGSCLCNKWLLEKVDMIWFRHKKGIRYYASAITGNEAHSSSMPQLVIFHLTSSYKFPYFSCFVIVTYLEYLLPQEAADIS